jgi:hypothetical protein
MDDMPKKTPNPSQPAKHGELWLVAAKLIGIAAFVGWFQAKGFRAAGWVLITGGTLLFLYWLMRPRHEPEPVHPDDQPDSDTP